MLKFSKNIFLKEKMFAKKVKNIYLEYFGIFLFKWNLPNYLFIYSANMC